ncbi:MAG: hypothetical protein GX952_06460 [Firmicutes bacterium]|nr:hypothetical protein [Bacillota bacterium]
MKARTDCRNPHDYYLTTKTESGPKQKSSSADAFCLWYHQLQEDFLQSRPLED